MTRKQGKRKRKRKRKKEQTKINQQAPASRAGTAPEKCQNDIARVPVHRLCQFGDVCEELALSTHLPSSIVFAIHLVFQARQQDVRLPVLVQQDVTVVEQKFF